MADTPAWLRDLLGWKEATKKSKSKCRTLFQGLEIAPNLSDLGSVSSMHLAGVVYDALGIDRRIRKANLDSDSDSSSSGTALERAIQLDIRQALPALDPDRDWLVSKGGDVAAFAQFTHLSDLRAILKQNPTLRATFAGDYQVETDVYVGVRELHPPRGPSVPSCGDSQQMDHQIRPCAERPPRVRDVGA